MKGFRQSNDKVAKRSRRENVTRGFKETTASARVAGGVVSPGEIHASDRKREKRLSLGVPVCSF